MDTWIPGKGNGEGDPADAARRGKLHHHRGAGALTATRSTSRASASEVGAEYNGWDDPVTIEFADMPQKGIIKIVKHDATTDESVDGEHLHRRRAAADIVTPEGTVRASADDIVATLCDRRERRSWRRSRHLGTYTVYEAKAKDGFALNV